MNDKATIEKLRKYCAYQERCHQEVYYKALQLGLRSVDVDSAISVLITENFLNEQRFAQVWVGGRMRIKKWGQRKIEQDLVAKQISPIIIREAMAQYSATVELENIQYWFQKKWIHHSTTDIYVQKHQFARFLFQKGFDIDKIWEFLAQIL